MAVNEFIILLYGYHSLQTHRVTHALWNQGRKGILLDHGTGLVIGETAVIGDRVSQMQGVTLGGIGNIKIGEGARIASGSLVFKDVTNLWARVIVQLFRLKLCEPEWLILKLRLKKKGIYLHLVLKKKRIYLQLVLTKKGNKGRTSKTTSRIYDKLACSL
ncbi:putative serine O-acetyltransferase [Helianthus annuus]|nr:putative serine O-acetyltransferase [Helianthus annuus]